MSYQIPGAQMVDGVFGAGTASGGGNINSGTIVDSAPFSITQTWNDGAEQFKAFTIDITDTASLASSLVVDWKVGGFSMLKLGKNGDFQIAQAAGMSGIGNISCFSTGKIGFESGGTWTGTTIDTYLTRDAAGILAQRNGVNAQAFRVYNTFTDAANGEWLDIGWAANVLTIGNNANGTGTAGRQVTLSGRGGLNFWTNGGAQWSINTSGVLSCATGAYIRIAPTTVAGLPAAATAGLGARHTVSDATATLTAGIGAVVVGGGANGVPVFSDGTNWRIG